MNNIKRAFVCFMIGCLMLLSYRPLQEEITSLAGNATLTNALIDFLDSFFQYIWIILLIMVFGLAIYFVSKELS